jgi:hypothetical protein
MENIDKDKLLDAIKTYAVFYKMYREELDKGNPNYGVWKDMVNEKLSIVKTMLEIND